MPILPIVCDCDNPDMNIPIETKVLLVSIAVVVTVAPIEWSLVEFSLNVFTEFVKFSDKNICHYSKGAQTCHPATSCVRDQDATTAPARHM